MELFNAVVNDDALIDSNESQLTDDLLKSIGDCTLLCIHSVGSVVVAKKKLTIIK